MDIPLDVLNIMASYITKNRMKLLDWVGVNINRLPKAFISQNPNAIDLLETHKNKIN